MPRTTADTIPGVKQIKKASGKVYYRHRKTQQNIDLPYPSPEFDLEVARLDALVAARAAPASEPLPGSLGMLIEAFKGSPQWAGYMPRTQEDYNAIFNFLKPGDNAILRSFTRGDVIRIRDSAHKKHKFKFANYVTTVLSVLFNWAVERELMPFNPAAGIKKVERPKHLRQANRPWTEPEKAAVLAAATGGMRVAVGIGIAVAPREEDMLAMTWANVGKDGWLRWKMKKTGDEIERLIPAWLTAILAEAKGGVVPLPSRPLVVGERSGEPYTEDGFRTVFFRLIRRLERAGKVAPGLTYHGLRHTQGTEIASRGGSEADIMTALGHRTTAMAAHYSKGFSRKKRARNVFNLLDSAAGTADS